MQNTWTQIKTTKKGYPATTNRALCVKWCKLFVNRTRIAEISKNSLKERGGEGGGVNAAG